MDDAMWIFFVISEDLDNITLITTSMFFSICYIVVDGTIDDFWNGVKESLGILQIAIEVGCQQVVFGCVNFLEAVPCEESE